MDVCFIGLDTWVYGIGVIFLRAAAMFVNVSGYRIAKRF